MALARPRLRWRALSCALRPVVWGWGLAGCFALPVSAAEPIQPLFEALRLEGKAEIELDGRLDDAVWARAPLFDAFHQNYPTAAFPAQPRSELRLVVDREALWIGLKAFDDGLAQRRLNLVRRDQVFGDQDLFLLMLDSYGRHKSAMILRINAAGSIGDGLYNQETDEDNFGPDFPLDVVTAQHEAFWTAEIRIPLSTLRYPVMSNTLWNLAALRIMPKDGLLRITSVPLPRDLPCLLCGSRPIAGTQQVPQERSLSLTPQISLGRTRESVDGVVRQANDWRVGGNFKVLPAPGWVVDGTIRPDFSSVELDIPQLAGNTRRALYYPEKRPFFLESADLIEQRLRLVSTRRIEDPIWGARATYRDDDHEWVMLTARDRAGGSRWIPGPYETASKVRPLDTQASFVRGLHHLGDLSVGMTATDRRDGQGHSSLAGTDLAWRPNSTDWVRAGLAGSDTAWPDEAASRGRLWFADWVRQHEHYGLKANWESVSPGFRADNGFLASAGYRHLFLEGFYKQQDVLGLTEFSPMLRLERMTDNLGQTILHSVRPGFWFSGKHSSFGEFELKLGEQVRPGLGAPLLSKNSARGYVEAKPFSWMPQWFLEAEAGERVDYLRQRVGHGYMMRTGGRIRLGGGVQVEPQYLREIVNGGPAASIGQPSALETMLQVRTYYQINHQQALRLTWQKHRVAKPQLPGETGLAQDFGSSLVSLVYSYTPRAGRSVYVGATRNWGFDRPDQNRIMGTYVFVNFGWTI